MTNTKESFGIICSRRAPQGTQLLMIKKATTYYFCEFVMGKYHKKNRRAHLERLFGQMSYHEKVDILSLRYENLWYRVCREQGDEVYSSQGQRNKFRHSYINRKSKFEQMFLTDGGAELRRLIGGSPNVDTPWEFPRGRANIDGTEGHMDTAIREFHEETGVTPQQYRVLWHIKPYVESYKDLGTVYKNTYYFAEAVGDWEPEYKFSNGNQVDEVSRIRWVSRSDLPHMALGALAAKRLSRAFEKITRKLKNAPKTRALPRVKKKILVPKPPRSPPGLPPSPATPSSKKIP
jgi:8-oxo-dGTP pyrophosphatase MutT (NUDIX family)